MSAVTRAPSEHRARTRANTVEEILSSARKQLADGDQISLRQIAKDIGVTAPALYRYFPSAAAIELAIAREAAAEVVEDIRIATADASTPGERLSAAWGAVRWHATEDTLRMRLVLGYFEPAQAVLTAMDDAVRAVREVSS